MKVYIEPRFEGQDEGDGGIRRVVEGQRKWLPRYGIEVVDSLGEADLVATHAAVATKTVPVGIPWVVHTHGLYWSEYTWHHWSHSLNAQVIAAMRQATHVTAPSEWVAQAFRRGMWLNSSVLYHGVDLEDWPVGTDGKYVLWNKNRGDPVCDPNPVIIAARQNPDIHFVSTFGADDLPNMEVTGVLPYEQAKEYVRSAGVYLCTTRETFGIGTLEAMAAGVPVVGWNWGGQREIIEHGVTGWLAPVGDYASLSEGIRWAQDNRDEIGQRAREHVASEFTWEIAIERYVDLYKSVLAETQDDLQDTKVSVIVPCYNLAQFLPDTIRSLQAQSMEDWEAIIVNDASPDNTPEVAASLAAEEPRVRVINLTENRYLAGALNEGIGWSEGRYVMPLDADNMIEPDTLARLSSALDSDRTIDIAYGGARFVLEDGVTPDVSVGPGGVSGWPEAFSFIGQTTGRNQIPSTALYRRRVWERSGGYRRRWRTSEDADFWTRATSLGFAPRKVSTRPTLIYRQREDSMSRKHPRPDYIAWYPWSRQKHLTPFGVSDAPPHSVNGGLSWSVPSAEPAKVGVIIPVGPGHEEIVIDALDSVEAQSYRQWQAIVINDTGHPLKVPHPWAKVIDGLDDLATDTMYHPFRGARGTACDTCGEADNWHKRMGPGRARNAGIKGLDRTVTTFVPLDADDYLQADAIDVWLRAYNEGGGVIYGQWFDDLGDRTTIYDPPDYDAHLLLSKGMIHAVTALYPISAWQEVGGFDEELTHWEDWDFHLRLAEKGICGTKVPAPLWTYRKTLGRRREENMAAFEDGKQAILRRWSAYWEGGQTLMACTGCGGGGGNRYPKPPARASEGTGRAVSAQPPEGYETLEFHGASTGTRMYKGQVSSQVYRFGNNPGHRKKFVYKEDVPGFLTFMDGGQPMFSRVSTDLGALATAPNMQAPGAPVAEQPTVHEAPMAQPEGPPLEKDPVTLAEEALAQAKADAATASATPSTGPGPEERRNPTVAELRNWVKTGPGVDLLADTLAKEKEGPKRPTAITLLERHLATAKEVAEEMAG